MSRRRRTTAMPVRDASPVPRQLDRADFPRTGAPWIVVLFSSSACASCPPMAEKVAVLESPDVAVVDVSFPEARDLHERYAIEAVPLVVVADRDGVVRASFLGPTSATDLWAAVAEVRAPGSSPEPGLGTSPG